MNVRMIAGVILAACGAAFTDAPPLGELLQNAGAYVEEFETRLAGIVSEEHYIQELRYPDRNVRGAGSMMGVESAARRRRRMRSDFLLVKPEGAHDWIEFRDVYEVDGEAVRDRDDRLAKLFLTPNESVVTQVADIVREGARYNLGPIDRTMNTPVFALLFLERRYQGRFKFKQTGDKMPNLIVWMPPAPRTGHFIPPANAVVIEYSEQLKGTMVHGNSGRDIFAHGRFWLEPTGRVLMTELVLDDRDIRGTVLVNYQLDPQLGLLVPTEMRERYDRLGNGTMVDGYATYGKFRQFQVNVDEKLGPIKK